MTERPAGHPALDAYAEADIHRLLTENPEIAEQGVTVTRREHSLVLDGEVESPRRRDEIARMVRDRFPGVPLIVDIGVIRAAAPTEVEELP